MGVKLLMSLPWGLLNLTSICLESLCKKSHLFGVGVCFYMVVLFIENIHTHTHTYITYMHAYIHTYIHIYNWEKEGV